jgi:hypothetical protein
MRMLYTSAIAAIHDPTGVADVGLKDIGRVLFHDAAEAVASVLPLTDRDGDLHLLRDLPQGLDIERVHRFLEE